MLYTIPYLFSMEENWTWQSRKWIPSSPSHWLCCISERMGRLPHQERALDSVITTKYESRLSGSLPVPVAGPCNRTFMKGFQGRPLYNGQDLSSLPRADPRFIKEVKLYFLELCLLFLLITCLITTLSSQYVTQTDVRCSSSVSIFPKHSHPFSFWFIVTSLVFLLPQITII